MGGSQSFNLTGLTGREYKILLNPRRFAGDPIEAARRFWTLLADVLADHLRSPEDHHDFDKRFEIPKSGRPVRFRDTRTLLLDALGYSLRVRGKGEDQKITLKLRTPDIFMSGLARVTGKGSGQKPKFEEDIAPLEVQARGGVTASADASLRSRFSRSTTQPFPPAAELRTLGNAFDLFGDLEDHLTAVTGKKPKASTKLLPGPAISEHVFKSDAWSLAPGVEIGFAFTLWYLDHDHKRTSDTIPDVAEISFKWELEARDNNKKGEKVLKPVAGANEAERQANISSGAASALNLFLDIQTTYRHWIDGNNASKTKLALPNRWR